MRPTRSDCLALAYALLTLGLVLIWGLQVWTVVLPSVLFLLLVLDGIFRPASPWFMPLVTHGPRSGHAVALTFDDGPDPEVTPQILDLLGKHGATATFFVIARHVEQHPELARRILAEGHDIGNHTYAHPRLFNTWLRRAMREEMARAQASIEKELNYRPQWFRPPVGLKNPHLALAANDLNLPVVMWSRHARDTLFNNPDYIAQRVLKRIRAGDIVDLHDGHDHQSSRNAHRHHTLAAVELILQGLKARGLQAVTLTELLHLEFESGQE